MSLSVLRAIFDPELRQELESLVTLIFELREKRTGLEYIRTILYYLSKATERVSRTDLERALLHQDAEGERIMATIAQEYIQQGIKQGLEQGLEQGIEQGLEQGLEKSILRVLQRRFGELPAEVRTKLDGLTAAELESLLDEALVVTSLQEFMAR